MAANRWWAFLLFLPAPVFADEVFLSGAGSISGQIVEQTETTIMVNIGDGVMGVPLSRVERIVRERHPLDEYDERAGRLAPDDARGWRELGRWASQQGMYTQSRQAYQKVRAVAPNDAEANEALGLVQHEGRWITEEESYRARGFVKYDGEWMTAKEAQEIEQLEYARYEEERRAVDAEIAALEAEDRAREAEAEAKKAAAEAEEEARRLANRVTWGGWGYGVTTWPSIPVVQYTPGQP